MKVTSKEQAWQEANKLIPNDYEKDIESSERAGYPIYRSNVEYYDYICDLGDRLEVNLKEGNRSVNIWIDDADRGEDFELTVTAQRSGEVRTYKAYAEFVNEMRFFLSSGTRYEDQEVFFEKCMRNLRNLNEDGINLIVVRSGLQIEFTYKKWRG